MLIECHVPLDQGGLQPAILLAQKVAAAYRGITLTGVRMKAPRTQQVGPTERSFQVNVMTRWEFDTLVTSP